MPTQPYVGSYWKRTKGKAAAVYIELMWAEGGDNQRRGAVCSVESEKHIAGGMDAPQEFSDTGPGGRKPRSKGLRQFI